MKKLGVVQEVVGEADFFEYLIRYSEIYQRILKDLFYRELQQNIKKEDYKGFYYNHLLYAVVLMLYFDKFPNGKYDEIVPLIARVVFSLRFQKLRISKKD